MFQAYTTRLERRAGGHLAADRNIAITGGRQAGQTGTGESTYPLLYVLREAIKHGCETITSLGRYASSLRGFYPMMLFMAEAAVAAQGYLIWPSVAPSDSETDEDAWFRTLDI